MSKSQNERILNWLKSGKTLTQQDAIREFACYRLSARIADLRKMGYAIRTETIVKNGVHFAKYSMEVRP